MNDKKLKDMMDNIDVSVEKDISKLVKELLQVKMKYRFLLGIDLEIDFKNYSPQKDGIGISEEKFNDQVEEITKNLTKQIYESV